MFTTEILPGKCKKKVSSRFSGLVHHGNVSMLVLKNEFTAVNLLMVSIASLKLASKLVTPRLKPYRINNHCVKA